MWRPSRGDASPGERDDGHLLKRTLLTATALVVGSLFAGRAVGAQRAIEFRRIDAHLLSIPFPAATVIRDSSRWATLWRRWQRLAWIPATDNWVDEPPPHIDFRHEMAIAIAMGGLDGCANVWNTVSRVVEWSDSIVVEPPPDPSRRDVTCAMLISPVDVVLIPRSDKRVVLPARELGRPLPPPDWWWQPSPSAFNAADAATKARFLLPLARDPATPPATIEAIAQYSVDHGWVASDLLLKRREIRSSIPMLQMLAGARDTLGRSALALLSHEFGATVAADPTTPRGTLLKLVRHLWPPVPEGHDVALHLLQNPTVVADSALVSGILNNVRDADIREPACRIYLAKWAAWRPATNPDGAFIGWNPLVNCPNMPPHPTR